MNIAYIHGFKFPPKSGGSVHAFQLTSNFIKKGNIVNSRRFCVKRPKSIMDLMGAINKSDVLLIRTDGSTHNENLSIFKLLNKKIPIIWEVNAPLEEKLVLGSRRNNFRNSNLHYENFKRKALARFTDSAVCVSKEMMNYSQKYLKLENSFLVPNGSDPEMFSPDKRLDNLFPGYEDYFKILWAGSAKYPWQGLQIIPQLASRFIDKKVIFIIITDKNHLSSDFNTGNFLIINEIPYLRLPEYLASVDMALCLYNDIPWSKWGFHFSPLKLFDYMSSGLPVIATGLGQIKEVISPGKNGLLTYNEIDDIVEKIMFFKNNPAEAKKIGNNARKTIVEYYNWERAAEDILKIMRSYL
jgi:glycosyltransferase involved in cell wall biosynthesis